MGTHNFLFLGVITYNPYIGGVKPSFFMVLGPKVPSSGVRFFKKSSTVVFFLWPLFWKVKDVEGKAISAIGKSGCGVKFVGQGWRLPAYNLGS